MKNADIVIAMTAEEYKGLVQLLEAGQWTGNVQAMSFLVHIYQKVKSDAQAYEEFAKKLTKEST